MALVQIPFVAQSPGTGAAIAGATVTVVVHGSGAHPLIYTAEDASAHLAGNTYTTDAGGRAISGGNPLWLAQGSYDFTVSGGSLSSFTVTRELISAAASDMLALVGEVKMWPTTSPPPGFLLCNGASLSRSVYAELFAVIDTAFGSADGSSFSLPDYRDRFPIGHGADAVGHVGGSSDHHHSIASGGGHSHSVNAHTHQVQAHYHGLSAFGGAAISPSPQPGGMVFLYAGSLSNFGIGWYALEPGGAGSAGPASGNVQGVALYGTTNSDGAGPTLSAITATDTQGAHDHGGFSGYTGDARPPFLTIGFIIRHGKSP